ncbi:MAG: YmdB family metallophosphoesterase [Firmicutes bacterium]|uniref:YmdB family metallophosphoesterase n=1 Tax=Candidatus Onthovivens merdipullorum TaxID=2840889 RepID=A0A9D9GWI0_9BACL|nr:YmdB family metallophosphoesterase [Candidatus Onthovivens merdipullorum]
MNILFIGDIVGKLGRKALEINVPILINKYKIDFIIANGENITNGKGISLTHYGFLKAHQIDAITLGNHYNHLEEIYSFINNDDIIRPLNIKNEKEGAGSRVFEINGTKIRVTNLLGENTAKFEISDSYNSVLDILTNDDSDIHIIDFHAEYTGEKKAFAYSLKNSVSAVIGTHTHVQTRDYQKLSTGPLYISDVGMCGLYDSVLGVEKDSVVERIIFKNDNARFKQLNDGKTIFSAVVLRFEDITFKPLEIIPIYNVN